MLACEESKAETVAQLKKEGRFKGTELLDVMVFREKSPKLKNAVSYTFWLCLPGIQGGRKWFDRLLSTLGPGATKSQARVSGFCCS